MKSLRDINLLELRNVTKIYDGGVLANHGVHFSLREGEIHGLVGENGAGKSTLMKVLFGMESITSGQLFLRGKEIRFTSSRDAIAHGIGMVHQHFMLVEEFTAAENLMLGSRESGLFLNRARERKRMETIARQYGFDIPADRLVRDMSVGMKQKLEILKIIYRDAQIIILDEPTAVLTPQETDELFERLLALKRRGMTIIFITHKLNEVKQISDRITVLKSGQTVGTYNTAEISTDEISNLMVGRVIRFDYPREPKTPGARLLKAEGLRYRDQFGVLKLNGVSLEVRDSEIVGIAGVEGNGQSELVGVLTAAIRSPEGKVYVKGREITGETIGDIRRSGVSYVPEDRMLNGCAASMSIQENLIASNAAGFAGRAMLLDARRIRENSRKLIKDFKIKTSSEQRTVKSLSGGNIQKVIFAREFTAGSQLLVLDQPTRGIDVGAISFIHQKILEMRRAGIGILLVSADLNELIALSDRILVMYKGEIVADIDNAERVSEQELGLYMLGVKRQEGVGGYEKSEAF
jgi:simple sugar transport system ATP-binding protein